MTRQNNLTIRQAIEDDAEQLCELLNAIISAGGTTAYETLLDPAGFISKFIHNERRVSCVVAASVDATLLGFQQLNHTPELGDRWGDIATFAKIGNTTKGVGTALFAATKKMAMNEKLVAIDATIRADNTGGLAYYDKMGFIDYDVISAVPLADGTEVDRIRKKFLIEWY